MGPSSRCTETMKELDFRHEANNMKRVRHNITAGTVLLCVAMLMLRPRFTRVFAGQAGWTTL